MSRTEFNPYAPPRVDPKTTISPDHYRIDPRRISYGEYRRMTTSRVAFALVAVLKALRLLPRMLFQGAVIRPMRLDILSLDQLPLHLRDRWAEVFAACDERGLAFAFAYQVPTLGTTKELAAAILVARDERTIAAVVYARYQVGANSQERDVLFVSSRLADGGWAVTQDRPPDFQRPPHYVERTYPGLPPGELLARHDDWLATGEWTAIPIRRSDLERVVLEKEQQFFDYQVQRGAFVPMTEAEVERLSAASEDDPGRSRSIQSRGERRRAMLWFCVAIGCGSLGLGQWSLGPGWLSSSMFLVGGLGAALLVETIRALVRRLLRRKALDQGDGPDSHDRGLAVPRPSPDD